MLPDLLKAFQGLDQSERRQKLKDDGYEVLRRGHLCSVYHKPDSDVVLRISMRPDTAELTCRHFMKHAANPYIPHIYSESRIGGGKHISVMEKLISIEELAESDEDFVFGMARAIATFPFGDKRHDEAHEELAKDVNFMAATRAIINCAMESFYDLADNDECLFPDRDVANIMFRRENGILHPVLVDTLTYTTPSNELASEFDNIISRLRKLEFAQYQQGVVLGSQVVGLKKGPPVS